MRTQIELLAPGGDLDSIRAAIAAGTNAIYCGLDRFNARNRANNLSLSDLRCVIQMAHQHQCQVFLTLNIVIVENELIAFVITSYSIHYTKLYENFIKMEFAL